MILIFLVYFAQDKYSSMPLILLCRAYYRLYKKGKNTALLPERAEMLEAIGFSDLPPRIISEEGETKQFTFVGDFSGSS
jgi:hypothetical protein